MVPPELLAHPEMKEYLGLAELLVHLAMLVQTGQAALPGMKEYLGLQELLVMREHPEHPAKEPPVPPASMEPAVPLGLGVAVVTS
jgi:hypothetical protein